MRQLFVKLPAAVGVVGFLSMTACSTGMEANRPVPVDLSQFHPGDSRFNVVSVAGAPEGSITDTSGPCDVYKLYTTGLGGFGKGVITAGETITDIGTLGLAEIIWTPVQAGTKPHEHTVMFCYDKNDRLLSVLSRDPSKDNSDKFSKTPETTVSTAVAVAPPVSVAPALAPVTGAANPAVGTQVGDLSNEVQSPAGAPTVAQSVGQPTNPGTNSSD